MQPHFLLIENIGFLGGFLMVLVVILVLLTLLGIFYLYFTSKTKERLALIEKGMDPNLANGDFLTRVGIIAGGFALGLILSDMMSVNWGPLAGFIVAGFSILLYTIYKRKTLKNKVVSKDE